MKPAIEYDHVAQWLSQAGLDYEVPEYHGVLTGMLCVHPTVSANLGEGAVLQELETVKERIVEELLNPEMPFTPLLPEDEPLFKRVDGLAIWCEGFLFGLATKPNFDVKSIDEEAQEALRDLTEISRVGYEAEDDEDGEEGENSFMELVEYVRTAANIMFLELHPKEEMTPPQGDSVH